ncbi:hypothetical protein CEXT_540061 [Caerostris extrusa]|uniref:Uncharacterized protein n=1 Tax=Caerostris extrusa TaxID=172846 RepID=A0AAV4T6D5_CAEEX|nr:hypothetical protein CEXT_540061 [Caerostris extrusa]
MRDIETERVLPGSRDPVYESVFTLASKKRTAQLSLSCTVRVLLRSDRRTNNARKGWNEVKRAHAKPAGSGVVRLMGPRPMLTGGTRSEVRAIDSERGRLTRARGPLSRAPPLRHPHREAGQEGRTETSLFLGTSRHEMNFLRQLLTSLSRRQIYVRRANVSFSVLSRIF